MGRGEVIDFINPARIKWCCRQTRVDIAELAAKRGIAKDRLENGKLTYAELTAVADYFGHTPLFFLEEEPPQAESVHSVAFRTIANEGKIPINLNLYKVIRLAEQHRSIYAEFLEELKEDAAFQPPALSGSVEDKAMQVREWLGLDDGKKHDFKDYRRILEDKGILIMLGRKNSTKWGIHDDSGVVGFFVYDDKVPLIFVKKTSPQMQTFTLFHELGHLLLHQNSCIDDGDNLSSRQSAQKEMEANLFASRCLLPYSILNAIPPLPQNAAAFDGELARIANKRGVSVKMVLVALLLEGKVTRRQYGIYERLKAQQQEEEESRRKEEDATPFADRYPYLAPVRTFGERYVKTILNAHRDNEVTLSKVCDYLGGQKVVNVNRLKEEIYK